MVLHYMLNWIYCGKYFDSKETYFILHKYAYLGNCIESPVSLDGRCGSR